MRQCYQQMLSPRYLTLLSCRLARGKHSPAKYRNSRKWKLESGDKRVQWINLLVLGSEFGFECPQCARWHHLGLRAFCGVGCGAWDRMLLSSSLNFLFGLISCLSLFRVLFQVLLSLFMRLPLPLVTSHLSMYMMRKVLSAVILVPRLRAGNESLYAVYESGPEKKLQRLSYLVTTLPKIVEVLWEWRLQKFSSGRRIHKHKVS